ncbi:hypothetical protein LTR85_009410 [Meristemomyces frigidus]|nr:hypothetical protein LTR85_009410 [Meristemomyces frigidus]
MPPKRPAPARRGAKPPPQQETAGFAIDHMQDVKVETDDQPDPEPVQATAGAEPSSSTADAELPDDPLQPDSKPISIASTPAATPNATPAPPSSRASATPSVQRLGSLNRPAAGSASPAARGRGGRPVAQPKFAGRRSATARAEAEKAEQERKKVEQEARAKEEAKKARWASRGRGGRGGRGDEGRHRGRGRGGFMGESDRAPPVASGPFSSGQVNMADVGKRRAPTGSHGGGGAGTSFGVGGGGGGWSGASRQPTSGGSGGGGGGGGSGGGGGGGGMSGVKREPGTGDIEMLPQPIKTEDGGYISSDEDEMGAGFGRMNVDDLGVIDLTQEEDGEADPLKSFQPVRLKREAHKERTMGLNADGVPGATEAVEGGEAGDSKATLVSEKKKGKQRAKDVEVTGEGQAWQGAFSPSGDEREPAIKPEPTDEDDGRPATPEPAAKTVSAETDAIPPQEPPSSPESKRKTKEKINKTRTLSGTGAPERPVYQTQDEVDEWERHQADLRLLYSELGSLAVQPPAAAADQDGDAAMEGAQQPPAVPDKKADKVYLFQFPPVLPDLIPVAVKPDPEAPSAAAAAGESGDAMDVDRQPNNNAADPVTVSDDPSSAATGGPRLPKLPSGAVGKLRIHRSGRATLDWGGTSLLVGMGADASFLQDVVVAGMPEHKVGAGAVGEGEGEGEGGGGGGGPPGWAMGMGQVKGKFVVTPDWEAILGG